MYRIFLDSNVALDLVANREPFVEDSLPFLTLVADGEAQLFISEVSLGLLIYMSFDRYKLVDAKEKLLQFNGFCKVISGGEQAFLRAMNSDFKDKEDALQYFTAIENKMDFLITRDLKDFKTANQIPVLTPKQFFSS
ncbi:type II toxin-antitoxin system VapC family toxin [Algoriphagus winogradskyi]|jgi:predicted nucleic acid-binding protein|uniref:Predicted nucleic acid-binding protein, contains PIN domain n=1 Tax=Algoriphagus winogradskyi TaxID=237017 RepID=A0ABY1P605_9BACT|nr:PIN domain-containing protein [Algoriphagus winogradskyi]SMP27072.1 Predicted nucleic acid-binding protein, contains PIN domain [Algoriphagus winogradskyi]